MINKIKKFSVENKKYRHLYLSLIFLLFLFIDMGIVLMTAFDSNFQSTINKPESYPWLQLMDSYLIAKTIFMPTLLAVITSRVADIENRGDMWKVLKTSGWTMEEIFDIKFLSIFLKYIIFQILEGILLVLVGRRVGITMPIPVERLTVTLISIIAISFAIMTIHYFLAIRYENQLIGLALSVCGSLSGIIGIFLPLGISRFILYSYYAHLISTEFVKIGKDQWGLKLVPMRLYPLLVSVLLGIFVFIWSRRKLKKLDF